ncbi:MAG: heavy metal translocating P-type ATPase [Pseudomonadota bacterium]
MSCCDTIAKGSANQSGVMKPDSRSVEEERLIAASRDDGDGNLQTDFTVPSMHCAGCISKIERGLSELEFVDHVRANLSLKRVSVTWQKDGGSAVTIDRALSDLGFEHIPFDLDAAAKNDDQTSRQLLLAMAVAGFAAANIMLLSVSVWSGADAETRDLFHLLSGVIAAPAIYFAGQPFFSSAYRALAVGRLNMDVPISLAVILAFTMSVFESMQGGEAVYFDASVTLLFFLLIGRYLDHMMRDRARNAVIRLGQLGAKGGVQVGKNGKLNYLPLAEIEPGMILRVLPGETVPVDGKIVRGSSEFDRSLVTGESDSVPVGKGTEVEAGTVNLTGSIEIEVTKRADASFLANVMQMMEAAENGRSEYIRIADRMAQIYAPAVHIIAFGAFLGWLVYTGGDWQMSLYVAIAVLIVTCPCALGLAVPVVHVIGASRLFENGILMKDGSAIERLSQADHIVFDKTGTLTTGEPVVEHAEFNDDRERSIAIALASHSSHPASVAVRNLVGDERVALSSIKEFPGLGVEGNADGGKARLGRSAWVQELANPGNPNDGSVSADKSSGLAFCLEGSRPTPIKLAETLRPGTKQAVESLKASGLDAEILSGDSAEAVERIAKLADIDASRHGQTPREKIQRLEELANQGHHVLMVGDGLNDAPALMASHVSMAPSSASDVGRLAADFVFTREDLIAVPVAVDIARRASRLVRQNFGLAIAYNCIAVPLAVGGFVTPLVAALAMSASSIVVVANSMRLNLGSRNPALRNEPIHEGAGIPEFAGPAA